MKATAPLPDLLPHAESRLSQTRADLDQFESALYASALPPQYWSHEIRKCVQFVESRHSKAHRDYYRAQSSVAAAQPAPTRNAKAEPNATDPAPDDRPPGPSSFHQTIEVYTNDGRATTKISDFGQDLWSKLSMLPEDTRFCRQILFQDGILPDHYAQMMTRLGLSPEPVPRTLFLEYTRDPFLALCRQELESQSEHLMDGEPSLGWTLI